MVIAIGSPALRAQGLGLPAGVGTGIPTGGAAGAAGLGTSASGASAAAGSTGFCANLAACFQKCQAKFCASQFGQMLGSLGSGPVASVTGGFLPSICPPPGTLPGGAAAGPPGSAASTAAAIQASEANAKARVAAIEYLGTVDCARWPEAQKALINGLRKDPNECVRFAAARALNSGCCCDKKVIDALRICVSGETTDGDPAENSCRVKAAAFSALQNCLMRVPEDLPPETLPPAPEGGQPSLTPLPPAPEGRRTERPASANTHIATAYNPRPSGPISYEDRLKHKTFSQTVDEARRTLFRVSQTPKPPAVLPAGQRSLFGALTKARNEVGAAQLQRAREQGLVPPRPDQPSPEPAPFPSGNGVEPASFSPASSGMPTATPGTAADGTGTAPEAGLEGPGPISNAEPSPATRSNARRGLIGMLFQPRGD